MEEDLKAVEFWCPVSHVAPMKKAAKEMDVTDIIIDKEVVERHGHRWRKVTMFGNNTYLFSLGFLTGMSLSETLTMSPLKEAIECLQNKIDKFKGEENETGI